jgi:hypothetical protein
MKDHTSTTRRSFFRKAGAAVAVPLAIGAGTAAAGTDGAANADADALRTQIRQLEDRDAIRKLHETFLGQLNNGRTEALQALYADPQRGRIDGIGEHALTRLTDDYESGQLCTIEVSDDGLRATATFFCIARIARSVQSEGTLADMMRIQGSDRLQHREQGVLLGQYRKLHEEWRIESLTYRSTA